MLQLTESAADRLVSGGGWILYVGIGQILLLLLVSTSGALGILITHLSFIFLPAKRIRDVLFFIGLIAFVVMFFLFRLPSPNAWCSPNRLAR